MIQGRAIIGDGAGNFVLQEIQIQKPGRGEVLVEIKASGVCHTDYDSIRSWPGPFIVGHEGAGIVLSTGEGVSTCRPGDRVVLNWAMPCGHCFNCDGGFTNICENHSPVLHHGAFNSGHASLERTLYAGRGILRSFNLGTMSTHTVVRQEAVFPFKTAIPFSSAAILGCGVMTGVGSVWNVAQVPESSSVVVIGCGGVGLNVIQGARIAGASSIIALDLSPTRLHLAAQFGATHTIQTKRDDRYFAEAKETIWKLTGRGADYAFECTGNPQLGEAPLRLIRHAGMAVQVSGIEQEISMDMQLFEWDKIYVNPLYGRCNPARDFPLLLKHYEDGTLFLDELISKKYTPENLQDAFDDMLNGRIAKGIIEFS